MKGVLAVRRYLKSLRAQRGLSQQNVADKLEVVQSAYCAIENGTRQADMTFSMMGKLAGAFDVPVQTIIDAETEYVENREKAS